MEKKVFEAFDELHMSDECTEKIRCSLNETRSVSHRVCFAPLAAAACLLLVIVLFANAPTAQAWENISEGIKNAIVSFFYPEANVKEQYQFENGNFMAEKGTKPNGQDYNSVQYLTGSVPTWLKAEKNGLYFQANGESIEISGIISDEDPFTYIFTDNSGIRHYIIVGGVYGMGEDGLENVGWAEFVQKAPYDMMKSWIGGYSKGSGPWYNNGRDALGIIPWKHPEPSND